jgi:hypothetical protein
MRRRPCSSAMGAGRGRFLRLVGSLTVAVSGAYRRRFLIEKYPHLADEAPASLPDHTSADVPDDVDEAISVLDELAQAGGPDLH